MGSLLRRSLKNDTTRSGIYLLLGAALFMGAGQAFCSAVAQARRTASQDVRLPGTQEPAPPPERYLPPAPVEYPFF